MRELQSRTDRTVCTERAAVLCLVPLIADKVIYI